MKRERRKGTEELLNDIKYVGILGVWFQGQQLAELRAIKEGLKNMATAEQVAALKAAIDGVEETLTDEINEVLAAIQAASGGGADPALDAEIARLTTLKDKIEGIITAAETPPADPPVDPNA